MSNEVSSLSSFYDSALGQAVCAVYRSLLSSWMEEIFRGQDGGLNLLGLGSVGPYENVLGHPKVLRKVLLLPDDSRGMIGAPNSFLLGQEDAIPLPDESMHCVVSIHSFEYQSDPQAYVEEIRRVLTRFGTWLALVPRRPGLWHLAGPEPFKTPYAFTQSEIRDLCRRGHLQPRSLQTCLRFIPTDKLRIRQLSYPFLGSFAEVFPFLGGAWMLRADRRPSENSGSSAQPVPQGKIRFRPVADLTGITQAHRLKPLVPLDPVSDSGNKRERKRH